MKKSTILLSILALGIAIFGYVENRKYHRAVVVLQKEHIKLNKIIKKFLEVPSPDHEYLENGIPAPSFSLPDTNGDSIAHNFSKKAHTLFVFSAKDCHYCEDFYPSLDSFTKKYPEKLDVVVLQTDSDVESNKTFLEEKGYSFKMLNANQELLDDYKINGTPTAVLLDASYAIKTTFVANTLSEIEYATEIRDEE